MFDLVKEGSTNYLVAFCLSIILAAVYKIKNKKARMATIFVAAGLALVIMIREIVLMLI